MDDAVLIRRAGPVVTSPIREHGTKFSPIEMISVA